MKKMIMTWDELAIMALTDQWCWWTPGASLPYWSNQAQFAIVEVVATAYDFVDENGIEFDPEPGSWEGEHYFMALVENPFAG